MRVGDVYFLINLFNPATAERLPQHERRVLESFAVYVLGIDQRHEGVLREVRVGTLKWLTYDGLVKTLSQAPFDVAFSDHNEVGRLVLARVNEASRLVCGKLVLISNIIDTVTSESGLLEPTGDMAGQFTSMSNPWKPCLLDVNHPDRCNATRPTLY